MAKDLHGLEWRFRHIYRGIVLNVSTHQIFWYCSFKEKIYRLEYHSTHEYFFSLYDMGRSTKEAFAHNWMECICKQEEAGVWGCCAVSQV